MAISRSRLPDATVRLIRSTCQAYGLPWTAMLHGAGLPTDAVEDPDAYVSDVQRQALEAAFVAASRGLPDAWFRMGLQQGLLSFGPLGLAALTAPTLGAGLRHLAVYGRLSHALLPCRPVEAGGRVTEIAIEPDPSAGLLVEFHVERAVGAAFRFIGDMHPGLAPVARIELAVPDRGRRNACEAIFGVPITFDAVVTRLILTRDAPDAAQPLADALLQQTNVELCADLLANSLESDALVDDLYHFLVRSLPDVPSPASASEPFGISERTLHRRLATCGLTYGTICDEARRDRAAYLLERTGLSIELVAKALGYAENASFTRAFKRWTGESPLQFRRGRSDQSPQV